MRDSGRPGALVFVFSHFSLQLNEALAKREYVKALMIANVSNPAF
jgi:hypothetical protein